MKFPQEYFVGGLGILPPMHTMGCCGHCIGKFENSVTVLRLYQTRMSARYDLERTGTHLLLCSKGIFIDSPKI